MTAMIRLMQDISTLRSVVLEGPLHDGTSHNLTHLYFKGYTKTNAINACLKSKVFYTKLNPFSSLPFLLRLTLPYNAHAVKHNQTG